MIYFSCWLFVVGYWLFVVCCLLRGLFHSENLLNVETCVEVILAFKLYDNKRGASQNCKLPTASKSEAIQTRTRKARVLRQSS